MPLTPDEELLNDRIIAEGLSNREDRVLQAMRDSHNAKIARVDLDVDKVTNFPDAVRWELKLEGNRTALEIEAELADQQAFYVGKKARLVEVVLLCDTEKAFRRDRKVDRGRGR